MYTASVDIDNNRVTSNVPVGDNPQGEAKRILPELCQFCIKGVSGRTMVLVGPTCSDNRLNTGGYRVGTVEVEEDDKPAMNVIVTCEGFIKRKL